MTEIALPKDLNIKYTVSRYPKTNNKSLQAWSKADEFIVSYIQSNKLENKSIAIYNDTFGFLSCNLAIDSTTILINSKSQEKAIIKNSRDNELQINTKQLVNIIETVTKKAEVIVLKIPKSLDNLELFLNQICLNSNDDTIVVCSFMTKYFTKRMVELAEKYFDSVEQSKAWKKSRLMLLKTPKQIDETLLIHEIESDYGTYNQYYGVFSSNNIDYATQFLIQNLECPEQTEFALDLASGNGILAKQIQYKFPNAEIDLVDDSYLAIESSKLNITGEKVFFNCENDLFSFEDNYFDYIVTNPPFHIEHEIDISLPLGLFEQASRCLTDDGVFQLVFNNHLNYATHLSKLFKEVVETAKNDKFTVLTCRFPR